MAAITASLPSQSMPNRLLSRSEMKIVTRTVERPAEIAPAAISTDPSVVHFGGFEVGKLHRVTLKLVNCFTTPIRFQVAPPSSPFFSIKYTKKEVFAPGVQEAIDIEFLPTEYRYYYDTLVVRCETGDQLTVPIHAYPVLAEVAVPSAVDFGVCPIQTPTVKSFSIKCNVPIDFEYKISILSSHPAFALSSMLGTIPANGEVRIVLTYTPSDYTTSSMAFELLLSQYNAVPIRCQVTGSCAPGALRDATVQRVTQQRQQQPPSTDRVTTSAGRTRNYKVKDTSTARSMSASASATALPASASNSALNPAVSQPSGSMQSTTGPHTVAPSDGAEQGSFIIPKRLDNMAAVNYILNHRDSASRGPVAKLAGPNYKKTHFALRREFYRQLKIASSRPPTLGDPELSNDARREILAARRAADEQYQLAKDEGPAAIAAALSRVQTSYETNVRPFRLAHLVEPKLEPQFLQQSFVTMATRMEALQRFVQAVRSVIIQGRLRTRLSLLKMRSLADKSDTLRAAPTGPIQDQQKIPSPVLVLSSVSLPATDHAAMPVFTPRVPRQCTLPVCLPPVDPFVELVNQEHFRSLGYAIITPRATHLPTEHGRALRNKDDPLPAPLPRAEVRSGSARSQTTKPGSTHPTYPGSQPGSSGALGSGRPSAQNSSHSLLPPNEQAPSREKIVTSIPPQLLAPSLPESALNPIPGVHSVLQPLPLSETDASHLAHPFADIHSMHARLVPGPMLVDMVPDTMVSTPEAVSLATALGQASISRFWVPRCTDTLVSVLPLTGPALLSSQPPEDAVLNDAAPLPLASAELLFDNDAVGANQTVAISILSSELDMVPAVTLASAPSSGLGRHEMGLDMCERAAQEGDVLGARIQQRMDRSGRPEKRSSTRASSVVAASGTLGVGSAS